VITHQLGSEFAQPDWCFLLHATLSVCVLGGESLSVTGTTRQSPVNPRAHERATCVLRRIGEAEIAAYGLLVSLARHSVSKRGSSRARMPGDIPRPAPRALEWIMNEPAFSIGVDDYRAGRPMRDLEEEGADTNAQWNYERGRQWAAIAPREMPVRIKGKLNRAAVEIARLQYGDLI
jgi:hypothetical protein